MCSECTKHSLAPPPCVIQALHSFKTQLGMGRVKVSREIMLTACVFLLAARGCGPVHFDLLKKRKKEKEREREKEREPERGVKSEPYLDSTPVHLFADQRACCSHTMIRGKACSHSRLSQFSLTV